MSASHECILTLSEEEAHILLSSLMEYTKLIRANQTNWDPSADALLSPTLLKLKALVSYLDTLSLT